MQKRTRRPRSFPIAHASARPTAKPPPDTATSCSAPLLQLNAPVTTAATANLKATSPDASLIRLSPFRIVVMRAGTLSFSVTALTATASVGEITAPKANAAASGSEGKSQCTR